MQIWAESGKSALPICNYSQILYQFLTFTQNLKRSPHKRFPQARTGGSLPAGFAVLPHENIQSMPGSFFNTLIVSLRISISICISSI